MSVEATAAIIRSYLEALSRLTGLGPAARR